MKYNIGVDKRLPKCEFAHAYFRSNFLSTYLRID